MELGLKVGVFDPHGIPGCGDQRGLEPWSALAHASGAAAAGAFVAARTQAGPGDQMGRRGKARHVDADPPLSPAPSYHSLRVRQEAGAIVDRRQGLLANGARGTKRSPTSFLHT